MRTLSATFLLLGALLMAPPIAPAADKVAGKWDAQWKKVDEAVQKGLPKTAIEELQPILAGAVADKNYPLAIKAIGRKIALEGEIQGYKPEEKIVRLDAEIAKAPAEMQPLLEVIQADWYWQYFQRNRWRFMQRTATAAAPGKDFTTWDLPRLFAEIEKHYQKALAAEEQLKKVPIQDFAELLDKGTMPDSYRPTLYDFVAHQALEFYNSGEQAAAAAEDAFELAADSPIFRPAEEFVAWKIPHPLPLSQRERGENLPHSQGERGDVDDDSITLKAIRLYQQLLRFHQDDKDKSAFLDADIERLSFGNNKAVGEEKAALYKAALKRFVKQWGDHPISAIVRYRWAAVLQQENSLVEAHDLAQQGAGLCQYARRQSLLQPREADRGQVGKHFNRAGLERALARNPRHLSQCDEGLFPAGPRGLGGWAEERHLPRAMAGRRPPAALLAKQPDLAWSADLPATEDYQQRVEDLPAPKDQKPGAII